MMGANGTDDKIIELFKGHSGHIDKQFDGIVRELDGIKGEFRSYNEKQSSYHANMESLHEDIKKSLSRTNLGIRLLARIMHGSSDKIYRLVVLLVLLLAGTKAIEFFQVMMIK